MTEVAGVVCTEIATVMTGKPFSFGVHTLKRQYQMAAESDAGRSVWIQAICDGYSQFHNKKSKKGTNKKKT
jgi:hypothetical protein